MAKIYNISVIDRDGNAIEWKGIPAEDVPDRKTKIMKVAEGKNFVPPLAFYKKEATPK